MSETGGSKSNVNGVNSSAPAPKSKKFKRKLTPFLCKEMLFEYAIGTLDQERNRAIEEYLPQDGDCQNSLNDIRSGIQYSRQLSQTKLDPTLMLQLSAAENALSVTKRYSSWKEWPEVLRWSLTAIASSVAIAGLVLVIPWARLSSFRKPQAEFIQVAGLDRSVESTVEGEPVEPQPEEAGEEGSGDEEMGGVPDTQKAAAKSVSQPMVVVPPRATPLPSAQVAAAASVPASTGLPRPNKAANSGASSTAEEMEADAADEPASTKETKAKGFVYRANMSLDHLDDVGPAIADYIGELGGRKAGEVEIGWKRGAGRYYHFSLPADNEEKLMEKLRAYGPVRISKDPHPRVMPQGQVRFILWIEPLN